LVAGRCRRLTARGLRDPHAPGRPGGRREAHDGGYLLENGQEDEYADRDTLALSDALSVVEWILIHGAAPEIGWSVDVPG